MNIFYQGKIFLLIHLNPDFTSYRAPGTKEINRNSFNCPKILTGLLPRFFSPKKLENVRVRLLDRLE